MIDTARARGRAYALLADLVARGLTAATREAAMLSPAIAAALDRYGDPDGPAIDHQHVLGDTVYPVEGAFLDPDGQVGGQPAERLAARYRSCGFAPDPRGEPAEHLATELRALAFLSAAEADALRDGEAAIAATIAEHQRALLDQHLLRWLPPLAVAVRRCGRPWPTALVDQIEELLLFHAGAALPAPRTTWALAPLPELLGDPEVSLRRIAAVLTTPARAGAFLSRADLGAIGRRLGLPRGFGSRVDLLENLLAAAGRFQAVEPLLHAIAAVVSETRDALAQARYEDHVVTSVLAPWRARCDETLVVLDAIGAAVGALSEAAP